ncbi:MAG: sigma 54-interacting transcriptional regulator [Oscillospiraceae bacterium]|nr:sigma 54-interacting transcriptional regulator [Oscillospiraceae bacterium]
MAQYIIPEEIRTHNLLLNGMGPVEAEGDVLEILREYDSIIRIQKEGILKLREDKIRRRGFNAKETGLVGVSRDILRVQDLVFRIQHADAPVLIMAETGCGKELLAREVQRHSMRWDRAYIKVNCSAFPESLFESELFGYEAGAFTGASKQGKKGLFEAADGGTLFLDEIGELPMYLQAKLLRVLQEQEITRVGGTESVQVDVRVIAATNQDLPRLVEEGKFRKDLYFRLNVLPIFLSPLRYRKEDIPVLANHFLKKYCGKYATMQKDFTQSGLDALMAYDWPGNVRELENIVERLVVWGTSEHLGREDVLMVTRHDRQSPLRWYDPEHTPLNDLLEAVEKDAITKALNRCGSTRKAAEELGITQSTLMRRLKQYSIYIDPMA